MRINEQNKSIDMEARDVNFFLPPYVRNYLFYNKNQMPSKIIFPMFTSVKVNGIEIPIEYISPQDPVAVEIAEDGSNIPEITDVQEAALDEKDEEIKKLKEEVETLTITGRGGEERGGTELSEHDEAGKDEPVLSQEELAKVPNPLDSIQIRPDKADGVLMTQEDGGGTELSDTIEEALDKGADIGLKRVEEMSIEKPEVSPARAAFAEDAGESIHKVEKEKYEANDKQVEEMAVAFTVDPDPEHQPPPERQPKMPPGGDLGPGAGPSDMHARDRQDAARTARDLLDEPDVDESTEKEFGKTVRRDNAGKPVVEDKKEG